MHFTKLITIVLMATMIEAKPTSGQENFRTIDFDQRWKAYRRKLGTKIRYKNRLYINYVCFKSHSW